VLLCSGASTNRARTPSRVASRRPSLPLSSEPWVPPGLTAVSGADRAFCMRIPPLKPQRGSTAENKDQKPQWGLQLVTPQPGTSPALESALHPARVTAVGFSRQSLGSGCWLRLLRAVAQREGGLRQNKRARTPRCFASQLQGPFSASAQQPLAPPAAGEAGGALQPRPQPLCGVPSAQFGAGALGGPGLGTAGAAELPWGGRVRAWSSRAPPHLEGRASSFPRDMGDGAMLRASLR